MPSTVVARVTGPAAAASLVVAPRTTGSLKICPPGPLVVMLPPWSRVDPAASVTRLSSGVVPPTTPWKVVTPEVLTISREAPLTVLASVTGPVDALRRVVAPS